MKSLLNSYNQIYRKIITIQEDQLSQESCIAFGMWSKYNPLNILSIKEGIGQFQSNCFQLIKMDDVASNSLNFIYSDCLNYNSKQIVKSIMFISEQDEQFNLYKYLDPFQYENVWYHFQFISWPLKKKVELIIIQQENTILKETIENISFFNEYQVFFTLGESFKVVESKLDLIQQGTFYSQFPGQIVSYDLFIDEIPTTFDFQQFAIEEYQSLADCICKINEQAQLEDFDLNDLDYKIYMSENINCDYSALSGWIKVYDVNQQSNEFTYQIMKMSSNIGNNLLLNENISTFQFFYLISSIETKIIIKTYSYNFPILTKDNLDKNLLYQKNDIKQWHYFHLELLDKKFNIMITFYNENGIQIYEAEEQVIQFNNQQFTLSYGNIIKDSQNYLIVTLKQLFYKNCKEDNRIKKCHYSCLDCDGPNISNCLSCSVESQRIYFSEYQQCRCPLSQLDYENKCINNEDLNINLVDQQTAQQNCKMGYFQLDRECIRCPSIIKDNLLTCLECVGNQQWNLNSICYKDFYLPYSLKNQYPFISIENYYLFDGSDLILCLFCDLGNLFNQFDLQNQEKIFEMFQFYTQGFLSYCSNTMDINNIETCQKCIISNCVLCEIHIDQQFCLRCSTNYEPINGKCIFQAVKFSQQSCKPPYYASFAQQCKLCSLINCRFCFEYILNSQKISLYNLNQELIEEREEDIRIGCVQCNDGYIFDFNIGQCIQQIPKIRECLSSFVKNSQEECIISTLENFQITRIINKCDNYLKNCLYCALDRNQEVFCIECIDGFILQDQQCYMNEEIGSNYEIDLWIQKIKGYFFVFVDKQLSNDEDYINNCGRSCIKCITQDKQYICDKCNTNYFDYSIRIQQGFYCLECPQLCQVCQTREFSNIKTVNPFFFIDINNAMLTQECIIPKIDPFIIYDPYLKFASYCLDGNCNNGLQLKHWQNNCFLDKFPRWSFLGENIEYMNQIGLRSLTFSIFFEIDTELCVNYQDMVAQASIKKDVFTLRNANLQLISINQFSYLGERSMNFYDYENISMINTEFIFLKSLEKYFYFENLYNAINLTLINFRIKDSDIANVTSLFYIQQLGSIQMQNFSITNSTFKNFSLFNLVLLRFDGEIIIDSLFISNCTFIDSQLFLFSQSLDKIQINNLILDQCKFYNFSLFSLFINYAKVSAFDMKNVKLQRNNIQNSKLIFCQQLITINLINLLLKSNYLVNSIILGFSSSLNAHNLQIIDNQFIQSSIIESLQVTNDNHTQVVIAELFILKNVLQYSNLISIFQNSYSNELEIFITQVQIQQNSKLITTNQLCQIFNLNSQKLNLNNFIIVDNFEILLFYLYDNLDIKLINLILKNQAVQQKVFLSSNCFQKSNIQNQLLLIRGFDNIQIENCDIINSSSIDESLIQIDTSKSKLLLGSIYIKNVRFQGNLLQQLNQIQFFSLLSIVPDNQIEIIIENLIYQNNFMHVYQEGSLKQSALLLYISSTSSNVFVNNLNCFYNSMTNSSNSFIIIRSNISKFSNIQITNHNILPYNIWKDYYPIKVNNENDQEETNNFIMQIYHIKSVGGVAFIETSLFSCSNCSFQDILVSASSVFEIDTLNEGIIMISNFSINSTRFSLKEIESSGCLTINSQNSLLSLQILSAQFLNVINKMSTSIFSITPSLLKNNIIIQDIQILNCISLINQIIRIQFINQIGGQNQISLINIRILQNQKEWEKYFQIIGLLTSSELLQITSEDNSLIYLENCNFYIEDLTIEGMYITPFLKLINVQRLSMINLKIQHIQSIKTQNLIQISQTIQTKSIIYLKQINIKKGYLFQSNSQSSQQPINFQIDYYILGCQIINNLLQIEQPIDYFSLNLNQLQQSNYQHNAIIQIVNMIDIEDNIYQTSLYGIVYFDISLFQQLKISKLNCNYNFVNEYGCLHFVGNNSVESQILIKDSNFINNNGTKGVAIKVTEISIYIKNCKIASNFARTQGGGLYIQITSNLFRIENTQILNNKAQEGGGIYFQNNNNLNQKNFNNSFLLFNQASIYGNNLIESPTHLKLFINSKEMPDEKQIQNNIATSILKIKPYTIIEQGRKIQTKQLIIPSNQKIDIYQLFITKGFFYQSYIQNISLYFQNSKGELLYKQLNSTCNVSSVIIQNNGTEIQDQRYNTTVQYQSINNNFELGILSFNFDPYQSEYDYIKILSQCKTQYSQQQKIFNYIMNAKSFKCQLGEFYVDNGCQICVWSQGFYSVTYNSIKCSIYDKIKFKNITSNMINLYEGYWRPNYLSDYTESCYKSPEYCQGGWEVGDSICSMGRKGALCEMCDIFNVRGEGSFFKNQQDLTCLSCSQNDNIILPFSFALFQALLSIFLSLKSIRRSNQLFTQLRIFEKFSKIIFKLNQDHEGILLKMLLNYLWIFSVIFTFNINFSFSFTFIEQSSNSFYFMVNNLDCYFSNLDIEMIYVKIIFIQILMLLQFKLILALSFVYHNIINSQMDNSLLSNTLLCLYVFNYGGLIKMFCSALSSRQISNINYIQGDVSLLYDTQIHQQWVYFIIVPLLLIYGCIIPFSLFLITYLKRDILYLIKLRKHICYLFNEYNDNNYYWEQIKLLQKAIIILITTYFENNILLKTSLLGLCLLSYQTIAAKNKPYIISKLNNLDLQSGQICSITIFLAATKYESQNSNNNTISTFLSIVLLILMIKLCYPFIYNIFTVYYKKYSYFILSKIYSLSKHMSINSQFIQRFGDYLARENERQIKLKKNFTKLKEYILPKYKNQNKFFKLLSKKGHLKSNTNSGSYLIKGTND
ncbi:unnamed protein product [Paramecium sonneborni]|uniref:Uncharacterized protein n=1 Tax=Paramecium sonneborni TaxID=65129 RepID=A0A8S1LXP0_9CILI|nr:unnamed protein product [Paramecium sonneborni]